MHFTGLRISSNVNPLNASPLNATNIAQLHWNVFKWLINNIKEEQKLLMVIVMSLSLTLLVLKQVNPVVVVTIWMTYMQKCVFLML